MLLSSMFDTGFERIPVAQPGSISWEPGKRIKGWCNDCFRAATGMCPLHLLPGCTPGTPEVVGLAPQSSPAAEYGIIRSSLLETRAALKEARDECRKLEVQLGTLTAQHNTTVSVQIGLAEVMTLLLELTDNKEVVAAAQTMLARARHIT